MELEDKIWSTVKGGYRTAYNPAQVLQKLKASSDSATLAHLFEELWDNLHHQGEVGLASYMSVPQLVSICIEKQSFDFDYIGLCVLIENCRRKGNNPDLPVNFAESYFESLSTFTDYLLVNFKKIEDYDASRLALALFAIASGQPSLGKALEIMDGGILEEFLEGY
jgi:hypothetical protein